MFCQTLPDYLARLVFDLSVSCQGLLGESFPKTFARPRPRLPLGTFSSLSRRTVVLEACGSELQTHSQPTQVCTAPVSPIVPPWVNCLNINFIFYFFLSFKFNICWCRLRHRHTHERTDRTRREYSSVECKHSFRLLQLGLVSSIVGTL